MIFKLSDDNIARMDIYGFERDLNLWFKLLKFKHWNLFHMFFFHSWTANKFVFAKCMESNTLIRLLKKKTVDFTFQIFFKAWIFFNVDATSYFVSKVQSLTKKLLYLIGSLFKN